MRWLPQVRSPLWIRWGAIVSFLQYTTMALGAHWLLPNAQPRYFALGLFALVTGGIIAGLGWLGLRWFALSSSLGLLCGLGLMLQSFTGTGGWEDLIGPLVLISCLAGGVVLGLLVELIVLIVRVVRRHR